jgi:hypothetical protein
VLREPQHGQEAEGPAQAAPAPSAPGPGNRAFGALAASSDPRALARAIAGQGLGNRATRALISRDGFGLPKSTEDLHEQIYGDSSLAHAPSGPAPPSEYEFSDDPLAEGGFEPGKSIRIKPGPVRTDLIKPKGPDLTPRGGEWLEEALKRDKLLKELPDWARKKAIDALKDVDETIAEKIIDALPWDANVKAAATAALKALLQTAKGKKLEIPPAPPATRAPDWSRQPDFQPSPGQVIIPGPVWRF